MSATARPHAVASERGCLHAMYLSIHYLENAHLDYHGGHETNAKELIG